jgi:hypothetical protein
MEERDQFTGFPIATGYIRPFVAIAMWVSKSKIV